MKWDFVYRGETKQLDDQARATAPGCFVKLHDGCVHYELKGPAEGHTAVLVPGFSVPYFIWDPTFEALTAAGWRVLRFDLFGRGYSDRPDLDYDIELFIRQLRNLLDVLHLKQVHLIGLSMGGAISAAFTVRYPEIVCQLILIDPIGTLPMPLGLFYKAAALPGISELVLGVFGSSKLVRSVASDFFEPALIGPFQDRYRDQMKYRGFKRAIISTLRNKLLDGFPEVFAQLGKLSIPVLLLWGRNDSTVPIAQSQSILKLVRRAEFHVIDDAGHIPQYEQAEAVTPILLNFLNKT